MEILKNINQLNNLLVEYFDNSNVYSSPKTLNGDNKENYINENKNLNALNIEDKNNFVNNKISNIDDFNNKEDRNINDNKLSTEIKQQILNGLLISTFLSDEYTSIFANIIKNMSISKEKTSSLCELFFQLNNYLPLLCNLTIIFLKAKKYQEIHLMVSKIFVAHIGTKNYCSSLKCTFTERNFDRFIEIVKNCDIKEELYIPFLIEIFKSDISGSYGEWKRPALEYLQTFWNSNEQWMLDFIDKNPVYRYGVLDTILQFNTNKGVELLIKDYFLNGETDLEQILNLVKLYKREVLFYIDNELLKADTVRQAKLVELLLNFDNDNEIMSRIKELLATTNDKIIKQIISNKMGISETLNIKTEKQFLNAVRNSKLPIQERILGIPFDKFSLKLKSGYLADNAVYTFLIYLFKEEKNLVNLKKLKVILNIFETESFYNMLYMLYDVIFSKPDIKESKWGLRLLSLLGDEKIQKNILDFIVFLCKNQRVKEAKYLILCMVYSEKTEIISVIKRLLEIKNPFILENFNYFIETISNVCKIDIEDLKDMLVLNNYTEEDYQKQKSRLFEAFLAEKHYNLETFKHLFIENSLFNKFAQQLIFGEYRFGRLYNAFIVKDKNVEFLIGKTIIENPITNVDKEFDNQQRNKDIYISIIHPLDCDFKFEKLFTYYANPPFPQFEIPKFNNKLYNNSTNIVNKFVGVFINPKAFIMQITKYGFIKNKNENETKFKSFVHLFPSLNLICEVELEQLINEDSLYASLGNIYFYKLNQTFKVGTKYITQKSNAINLKTLPSRYFNYILTIILDASKAK